MIRDELNKLLAKKGYTGKIEHPAMSKFGDFAVRGEIDFEENDLIEKTEKVAGFTNIWIKKDKLKAEAEKINYEIEFKNELAKSDKGKTMVIDYSAPNIAKPFGIGHLRSTNIGQAIYNIYKILGWNCIGDNHLGDWGTQFGKLIVAIKKWNDKEIEKLSIEDLEKLYVRFHAEEEKNPEMEDEAREWFAKLENGDAEARDIWQKCIDISVREFNQVYEMLGVKIDYTLGESFYLDKMPAVIEEMRKKGLIKKSEGAEIVEFKNMPPAMVKKTNETTTYFTRDMATVKYRVDEWKPDLIIYEVGSDQILHLKQVFETAKMLGYKADFVHVAHGMFRWKDGKFSTRGGRTIHLSEVIKKAKEEAKKMAPDNSQEKIAAVAIGAIKFNDLAQDPKKDIIFDWERVMSMDGNSGPYLQYTYARCMSVLGKTEIVEQKNIEEVPEIINEEESELLREFYKLEEKILEASERFNPAVIAEFLLNIARKYNEFYGKHRIIGEPEETWRIFLTKVTSNVLKTGLELLGIKTIEKM
jgi:arginyl-tRNA synthetase